MHPGKGYLYYTDWSLQPYIGRIPLDGSPDVGDPVVKLAENDLGWPNALTIDYYADRLAIEILKNYRKFYLHTFKNMFEGFRTISKFF